MRPILAWALVFHESALWAMVIAIIIASVPSLQHLFFDPGTFVNNSVSSAIKQSGGVAVPLILVVLGLTSPGIRFLKRRTLPTRRKRRSRRSF